MYVKRTYRKFRLRLLAYISTSVCPTFANNIIFSYMGIFNIQLLNTVYRWCVFDNKGQAVTVQCRWEERKHKEHSHFLEHLLSVVRSLGRSPSS